MTPITRRAMQEWTERQSPLLTAPPPDANTAGLTEEDIQGEVRRQVQSVMTDRDQRMQALQLENAELKSLLTSFLERTKAGGSAQSSGGAQAGDGLHGLGGNEPLRPLGVACGFSERGQETSLDPPSNRERRYLDKIHLDYYLRNPRRIYGLLLDFQ